MGWAEKACPNAAEHRRDSGPPGKMPYNRRKMDRRRVVMGHRRGFVCPPQRPVPATWQGAVAREEGAVENCVAVILGETDSAGLSVSVRKKEINRDRPRSRPTGRSVRTLKRASRVCSHPTELGRHGA